MDTFFRHAYSENQSTVFLFEFGSPPESVTSGSDDEDSTCVAYCDGSTEDCSTYPVKPKGTLRHLKVPQGSSRRLKVP